MRRLHHVFTLLLPPFPFHYFLRLTLKYILGRRVLSAEIDLDDIIRGNMDLDVRGHYSRPDIFKLSVRQ